MLDRCNLVKELPVVSPETLVTISPFLILIAKPVVKRGSACPYVLITKSVTVSNPGYDLNLNINVLDHFDSISTGKVASK